MDRVPQRIVDDEDGMELVLTGVSYEDQLLTYAHSGHRDVAIKMTPGIVVKEFIIESRRPEGELILQGKYECAAAALAMILGHSLFQVKRAMGMHGWCNDDGGAGDEVLQKAAREFGRDLIYGGKRTIRAMGSDMPDAMVSVRSVNVPKMGHGVAWLNGEILDPNFGSLTRKFWGAEWAPWTMGASNVMILAKEPLSDKLHKDLKFIRNECTPEEIREVILELAV